MNMFLSIASLFAGPIGSFVNTGIKTASAAALAWAVTKGVPLESATVIISSLTVAASTVISMAAQTQGVQIPRINALDNGVKVVPATANVSQVNAPLK